MSTSSKPQWTTEQTQKLREKFTHFRILVIGRANAGKTTILRKVCNTTGEPVIFSPNGEKIESSALDPSMGRGMHDIENQMVFESNPGFIFHDSRGFEAGSAHELKLVQEFIKRRSKERKVNNQLHAICFRYCIPTSDDRPITAAEKKFFNECGTGLVPVIVLWTKTDSLDLAKIKQLMKEGNSRSKAIEQAPEKAWADFERNIYQRFDQFKYQPKAYVVFRNMDKPEGDCNELIEKTTAALSSGELQQLFVSTQQNNVEICVRYGIERIASGGDPSMLKYLKNKGNWANVVAVVLAYFPHFWIEDYYGLYREEDDDYGDEENDHDFDDFFFGNDSVKAKSQERHNKDSISKIMSPILSGLSAKFNLKEAIYCAIVAGIISHLAFFLHQESPIEKTSLKRATQIYQQSACDTAIKQAVERIFQLENLFKGSELSRAFLNLFNRSHANHELLTKEAVQVALDNLLKTK